MFGLKQRSLELFSVYSPNNTYFDNNDYIIFQFLYLIIKIKLDGMYFIIVCKNNIKFLFSLHLKNNLVIPPPILPVATHRTGFQHAECRTECTHLMLFAPYNLYQLRRIVLYAFN